MKKQSGIKKKKKKNPKTPTETKNLSETKHPKAIRKKTWNGCGAENRGLKGGGLWLPAGGAPPPLAEHRVWPPAPESLSGHRGDVLGERTFGQTNPAPLERLSLQSPSQPTSQ